MEGFIIENTNIIDNYKVIFDFIKNILSYIVIVTAVTIVFGYLRMIGFLSAIDNSWLINFIEYKTLLTWGIPLSTIVFIAFFAVLDDHFNFENNFQYRLQKYIFIMIVIFIIILFFLNFYLDIAPNASITFIVIAALLFSLDLSILADDLSNNKSNLSKNIIWIITMPFLLLAMIYSYGMSEGFYMSKGNFKNIAHINNKKFGVLLNNNNTVFLIDLNSSEKIKIIKIDDVDYFTKKENFNNVKSSKEDNKSNQQKI